MLLSGENSKTSETTESKSTGKEEDDECLSFVILLVTSRRPLVRFVLRFPAADLSSNALRASEASDADSDIVDIKTGDGVQRAIQLDPARHSKDTTKKEGLLLVSACERSWAS